MYRNVLQRQETRAWLLQSMAMCCSVWQCVAVYHSVLQCVAVCCSVMQCVAGYGNVSHCVVEIEN